MNRAVIYEKFGGPEVLELRDLPEPHAGPGEVRVRIAAVGLNPMDPAFAATPELAARFHISLPSGFGYDFAGSVDEVGDGAGGFRVGDRVYGGVLERAAADFVVMKTPIGTDGVLSHTPEGLSDELASTLYIAGATASAALAPLDLTSRDTVLVGGAAGGVGVFVVQLARLAGAAVIGTASEGTFSFLRELGAEPVAYGAGLEDRVRASAPGGITAAIDLFGTETIETALALGLAPDRITAIAAGPNPPGGVRAVQGGHAEPDAVPRIAAAVAARELTVPIAARFPIEQIREAATLQADRHTHGKIVVML
ncbi:MAG: NADP-dependent oxidoreductase [Candidatus Dormibacteraceae bacterium]